MQQREIELNHVQTILEDKTMRDVESLSGNESEASAAVNGSEVSSLDIRTVGWKKTTFTMMKTQVGIGVLGIPGAFHYVGLIPGILLLGFAAGVMTWSNYMIGQFKGKHPQCYGLEDAAHIMFGRCGKFVFMGVFLLYWMFVTGSAIATLSSAFNALTHNQLCTAAFVAISAVLGFVLCSVPNLRIVSFAAIPAMFLILSSVLTLAVAVSLQDRPAAAPQVGPWKSDWQLVGNATFAQTMTAISTMIFAFSGTPAFFQIEAEMKNPKHYYRAMFTCQSVVFSTYLLIGTVVYYYCGSFVTSPALGSAGPTMKIACYAIAFPGLCVTAMIVAHIPAKAMFMQIARHRTQWQHLASLKTPRAWGIWLCCTSAVCVVGYLVASAIPGFDSLVSLIGALFGTFISIVPYGAMWLYVNLPQPKLGYKGGDFGKLRLRQRWHGRALQWRSRSLSWKIKSLGAVLAIVGGIFCVIGGTYGSALNMKATLDAGSSAPWTCETNA